MLPVGFVTIVLVLLVAGFIVLNVKQHGLQRPVLSGMLGLILIFIAGYLNTLFHTDSRKPDHLIKFDEPIVQYVAVVSGYAEEKKNSWKVEAQVQQVYDGSEWHLLSGKILLYFSRKDFDRPFDYGDRLLLRGSPAELQEPANPGEFDYKRFLTFRKIYHQPFLRAEQVQYVSPVSVRDCLFLSAKRRGSSQVYFR